ncbi:hypothetical protein [Fibrivirga algicola]|uniref:hypothetical protein n=1 Tax=Fibrivirga algicola TaxID=2950420 RepID=UPI001AAEF5D6|nr:hypothetical protein [Fibrivirga algicola]
MDLTLQIGFSQFVEAIRKLLPEQRKSIRSVLEEDNVPVKNEPRQFGSLKGLVTYIADDFDVPLGNFKEYM